jgi:hypothetical protein
MAFHSDTGRRMVEVYDDRGEFVACIYPVTGANGIHIISKHFADEPIIESEGEPPGYIVRFKK